MKIEKVLVKNSENEFMPALINIKIILTKMILKTRIKIFLTLNIPY